VHCRIAVATLLIWQVHFSSIVHPEFDKMDGDDPLEDPSDVIDFFDGVLYQDLISANGLQTALGDLRHEMRGLTRRQTSLECFACTENLDKAYVTRTEYGLEVQKDLQGKVDHHDKKLGLLDLAMSQTASTVEDHRKSLKALQAGALQATERMNGFEGNLERVEKQDLARHEQCLQQDRDAECRCLEREQGLREVLEHVHNHLQRHDKQIEDLLKKHEMMQAFLFSEQLGEHIRNVCEDLLKVYILKTDMLAEADRASEHCVGPVRKGLQSLVERFEQTVTRLSRDGASTRDQLLDIRERAATLTRDMDNRLTALGDEVHLRATLDALHELSKSTELNFSVVEDKQVQLKAEAINKMQELNARVGEFQVLLEDHEHALQHHAEELMNRSTKYDLVVCQQRLDQCATRHKVDKDFKELQTRVEWATTQLEVMGYGRGFGSATSEGPPESQKGVEGN